jgi:hypothetical protein
VTAFCIALPPVFELAGLALMLQGAGLDRAGCLRLTDALVILLQ